MSLLDALVIALALVCAVIAAPGRYRPIVKAGLLGFCGLAVWQVLSEGFYWQLVPLYGLVAVVALLSLRPTHLRAAFWMTGPLAALSLLAWGFLPAPSLPMPKGPYGIGSVTFRWVDRERLEEATDALTDHRNVIAQAWYPAEPSRGPTSRYIDGLGRLPPTVNGLPGWFLESFRNVETHARVAAPVSQGRSTWPVVIFSPGYGATRAVYTSLVSDLASRGFIVMVLDHPYEAAVVELTDGRLATPIERFLPSDPDRVAYMERQIKPRVGDVRHVLDRLQSQAGLGVLTGRMDINRVAVIGHSFGGATAALTLARDPRAVAGADLDGMLYGGAERWNLGRPFLVLQSDPAIKPFSPLYASRVRQLLAPLGSSGQRAVLAGAGHLSFTDAELFFARPARPFARRFLGARRPATEIQREAVDTLERFLNRAFETDARRNTETN